MLKALALYLSLPSTWKNNRNNWHLLESLWSYLPSSTSDLHPPSFLTYCTHPTTAEASEYSCRWNDPELYSQSEVNESQLHIIISDRARSHILWPVCEVDSNPWDRRHVYLASFSAAGAGLWWMHLKNQRWFTLCCIQTAEDEEIFSPVVSGEPRVAFTGHLVW